MPPLAALEVLADLVDADERAGSAAFQLAPHMPYFAPAGDPERVQTRPDLGNTLPAAARWGGEHANRAERAIP